MPLLPSPGGQKPAVRRIFQSSVTGRQKKRRGLLCCSYLLHVSISLFAVFRFHFPQASLWFLYISRCATGLLVGSRGRFWLLHLSNMPSVTYDSLLTPVRGITASTDVKRSPVLMPALPGSIVVFPFPFLFPHFSPRICETLDRLEVPVSAAWTREGTGLIWLRNSGY